MYRNPLKLIQKYLKDGNDLNDPNIIIRIKKQILTEFTLQNKVEIELDGKIFSKDDILKTFDEITNSDDLEVHKELIKHHDLLIFLENPTEFTLGYVDIEECKALLLLEINKNNYFNKILNEALLNCFFNCYKNNITQSVNTLKKTKYIFDNVIDDLFAEKLVRYIESVIAFIEKNNSKYKQIQIPINMYIGDDFILLLNELPEYLAFLRDDYAVACINYICSIQKINPFDCKMLNGNLQNLICNDEYKTIINGNQAVFENKSDDSRESFPWWSLVFTIITILKTFHACS